RRCSSDLSVFTHQRVDLAFTQSKIHMGKGTDTGEVLAYVPHFQHNVVFHILSTCFPCFFVMDSSSISPEPVRNHKGSAAQIRFLRIMHRAPDSFLILYSV